MRLLQIISWLRHRRQLDRLSSVDDFFHYMDSVNSKKFNSYQSASSIKKSQFAAVLAEIKFDPFHKTFLDLGPGYGDTLDYCHSAKAQSVSFTEIDPFFYTHNRLKMFTTPHRLNHLFRLDRLPPHNYDLIWCKGSIVADHAIFFERYGFYKWRFSNWLHQLEKLAKPNGHIVICPYWRNDGKLRRIHNLKSNLLYDVMRSNSYAILPQIPGHNHELQYPLTFHKVVA